MKSIKRFAFLSSLLASSVFADELLNVSYDPTRKFYQEFNSAFAKQWKQQTGKTLTVKKSNPVTDHPAARHSASLPTSTL